MREADRRDSDSLERALNDAIVTADIGQGYERFLSIVDQCYADDVELYAEGQQLHVRGRQALRSALLGVLVPLQFAAERGEVSVYVAYSQKAISDLGEHHAAWVVELFGIDHSVNMSWSSARRWRGARVVHERHYDQRLVEDALSQLNRT